MIVRFIYDASSCTIVADETQSRKDFFRQELGRCTVDLNPLHLGRELRWVVSKLKRLGYTKKATHKNVCDALSHALRAKTHMCMEI